MDNRTTVYDRIEIDTKPVPGGWISLAEFSPNDPEGPNEPIRSEAFGPTVAEAIALALSRLSAMIGAD